MYSLVVEHNADPNSLIGRDVLFEQQLLAMEDKVEQLEKPAERILLREFIEQIRQDHTQRQLLVLEAADAVEQLRLNLKYLIFDLEATKRERNDLRKLAEGLKEDVIRLQDTNVVATEANAKAAAENRRLQKLVDELRVDIAGLEMKLREEE